MMKKVMVYLLLTLVMSWSVFAHDINDGKATRSSVVPLRQIPLNVYSLSEIDRMAGKPFLNSMTALLLSNTPSFKMITQKLTLHPERDPLFKFKKNGNFLKYAFKLQDDPRASVVVIIPGIGSTATDSSTLYLAEQVYSLGFSVITLPSSTHWSFALAASSKGATGHLPSDSLDMHVLLQAIKQNILNSYSISPKHWGLLGTSYGTLDAAFLMQRDIEKRDFNFDFLVLINPPLNRLLATTKVDGYYEASKIWPQRVKKNTELFMVNRLLSVLQRVNPVDTFDELERAFPVKEEEVAWLMAQKFRQVIQATSMVSQILEPRQEESQVQTPMSSIKEYLHHYLYKKFYLAQTETDFEKLDRESELEFALRSHNSEILHTKKVILFHSINDFLSFPEGIATLHRLPVEKIIYPYGGHLGILQDQLFKSDLNFYLKGFKTEIH